jgi:hypothetical protein
MNQYLDSDSQRRQANTVVRLTVVTTLGLIATVSTGFLGMNLFDEVDNQPGSNLILFAVVIPSSPAGQLRGRQFQGAVGFSGSPGRQATDLVGPDPDLAQSLAATPAEKPKP